MKIQVSDQLSLTFAARQARNRRECIKSSARVYKRLLDFTQGDAVLHFDVIGALAYDENDELDEKRVQSLLSIFMPDKDDLLPQLSFVQSVDYVYKSLRFLRASIMNSSKIDSVLEDVFDVIYNVILALIVLTMIGINIWPLLVSFSTVMVSFAFSFGPSCAKYIEVSCPGDVAYYEAASANQRRIVCLFTFAFIFRVR